MSSRPEAIDASYAFCRRLSRRSRSSFYASFLLLPRAKRRAMDALYAFMRHTDDLADNPRPHAERCSALVRWRAALRRALQGRFDPPPPEDVPPVGLQRMSAERGSCRARASCPLGLEHAEERTGASLLPALADAVQRFSIPPEHLHAVIDGQEMDLARQRYESFDDLVRYCEKVASAVGLACIYVWGFGGDGALEPARKCGIAFQLTNILRDLKEDVQEDRIYLPLEDLRCCDYGVEDLIRGVVDERFFRLMALEIERAKRFYLEGAELAQWLQPDGLRTFGMMNSTYRRVLDQIERRAGEVLLRRIGLSRWQKFCIAARWIAMAAGKSITP